MYACAETKYTPCEADVCVAIGRMVPQCVEVCRVGEADCVGSLACVDKGGREVCVPDPCYTTACTRSAEFKPPVCVLYMYVADYHWYWVCVNHQDLSCPVYFQEQHGVTVTRDCVLPSATAAAGAAACVPTSLGNLDYYSEVCVDPKNARCPVYRNDWNGQHCYVPAVGPVQECYPTSGGLDYHSYLCVDSTDPKCPVYTLDWNGKHCGLSAAAGAPCFPTSGNLEETYLCVDPSNLKCPVYTTGPGGTRCYPLP